MSQPFKPPAGQDDAFVRRLHQLILDNNIKSALDILSESNYKNHVGEGKNSTLHFATKGNVLAIVQKLLENGADPNCTNDFGDTPLHLAAYSGFLEVCQVLLRSGADANAPGYGGFTPFHHAVRGTSGEVCALLKDHGAFIDAADETKSTAMHHATRANDLFLVDLLLKMGSSTHIRDSHGLGPLHIAAEYGFDLICKALISHKVSVNDGDATGRTPLHLACANGYEKTVALLLSNGANPSIRDSHGKTPADLAQAANFPECAKLAAPPGYTIYQPSFATATNAMVTPRLSFTSPQNTRPVTVSTAMTASSSQYSVTQSTITTATARSLATTTQTSNASSVSYTPHTTEFRPFSPPLVINPSQAPASRGYQPVSYVSHSRTVNTPAISSGTTDPRSRSVNLQPPAASASSLPSGFVSPRYARPAHYGLQPTSTSAAAASATQYYQAGVSFPASSTSPSHPLVSPRNIMASPPNTSRGPAQNDDFFPLRNPYANVPPLSFLESSARHTQSQAKKDDAITQDQQTQPKTPDGAQKSQSRSNRAAADDGDFSPRPPTRTHLQEKSAPEQAENKSEENQIIEAAPIVEIEQNSIEAALESNTDAAHNKDPSLEPVSIPVPETVSVSAPESAQLQSSSAVGIVQLPQGEIAETHASINPLTRKPRQLESAQLGSGVGMHPQKAEDVPSQDKTPGSSRPLSLQVHGGFGLAQPGANRFQNALSFDIEQLKEFVMRPGPNTLFECTIRKQKIDGHTAYTLFDERNNKQLLTAFKKINSRTSNFAVVLTNNYVRRKHPNYLGKLRGNLRRTTYNIYDKGSNPARTNQDMAISTCRSELGMVMITDKAPRNMTVLIPIILNSQHLSIVPMRKSESLKKRFDRHGEDPDIMILHARLPTWNAKSSTYIHNFYGRPRTPSNRNFQLEIEVGTIRNVVLQVGRLPDGSYGMDYMYPMSAFQAFCSAISTLDTF